MENVAAFARLKGDLIETVKDEEVSTFEFIVKWDTKPEPWDYDSNRPRLEFLPFASEPENLLPGSVIEASVAVKHPKESHFYVFDPNYYLPTGRDKNIVEKELVNLRLTFISSSAISRKDFVIVNKGKTTDRFEMKELRR